MLDLQALADTYDPAAAAAEPPPLPMEDAAADFVYADVDAQCVVVKNKGEKLYVAFNWRRRPWQVNDLARVHFLSPTLRRVADVVAEHQGQVQVVPAAAHDPVGRSPNGRYYDHHAFDLLDAVRFGKYLVLLNVSKARPFTYDGSRLQAAVNLATGRPQPAGPIAVPSRTFMVLELAVER